MLPEGYLDVAKNFTSQCLQKVPKDRPTYLLLLMSNGLLLNSQDKINTTLGVLMAYRRCS